jgi:hypothetical protein
MGCRILQEPHGITHQEKAFFIVTAVKTSDLTFFYTNYISHGSMDERVSNIIFLSTVSPFKIPDSNFLSPKQIYPILDHITVMASLLLYHYILHYSFFSTNITSNSIASPFHSVLLQISHPFLVWIPSVKVHDLALQHRLKICFIDWCLLS